MLKFLLILVLIILVLRAFGKFFIVTSFNRFSNFQNDRAKQDYEESKKREGQITIENNTKTGKSTPGEYVDYEEVK